MSKKVKEYFISSTGELVDATESLNETKKEVVKENNETITSNVNLVEEVKKEAPLKEEKIEAVKMPYIREAIIPKNSYNEDSKLLSNPFFYDYNPSIEDNIHNINTIEDFYVPFKKNYYNFGSLVRDNYFSLAKRKKILREQLKTWNREFEKRLSDVNILGSSHFQTNAKTVGKGMNIVFPILAFLTFVVSLIVVNGNLWVFKAPTKVWAVLGNYFALASSIFSLLIVWLINRSVRVIRRLHNSNKSEYNKIKSDITREFEKKYNSTYAYYVSTLRKNFKKPVLVLSKTAIGEANIKKIENVITDNSRKLLEASKTDKKLVFPKYFLGLFIVLSCIFVVGYAVLEIAMHFLGREI